MRAECGSAAGCGRLFSMSASRIGNELVNLKVLPQGAAPAANRTGAIENAADFTPPKWRGPLKVLDFGQKHPPRQFRKRCDWPCAVR